MGNRLIKILFVILYALYTAVAVNTRLVEQIIPYGNFYAYFYVIVLVALLLMFHYKPLVVRKKNLSFKTIGLFTIYITLFSLITLLEGPEGNLEDEVLAFLKFIATAAVTIYFVEQFDLLPELLLASFIGGSGLLLYEYALAGFPLDIFSRLGTFFSNSYSLRYRLAFNFNNYNTVGNIASCMLILYFLLISWFRNYERRSFIKIFTVLICTAIAAVDMITMLSSGSRNSMLTLIFFFIALLYFKITETNKVSVIQKRALKILIVGIGIVIVYLSAFSSVFSLFENSGRLRSFRENIPLVFRRNRFFEGLGLMNPGLFGRSRAGYIVDNYYLYVFMETGIVGLVIIAFLLSRLGKKINELRVSREPFFMLLSSAFVAWLVSGIGETCVIYPYFASSLVFFVVFLVFANKENYPPIEGNRRRKG